MPVPVSVKDQEPKYKDRYVQEAMKTSPAAAFIWYMMAGYSRYVCSSPIVTTMMFEKLQAVIITGFGAIQHPWKESVNVPAIRMGTKVPEFKTIPTNLKETAHMHIQMVYGVGYAYKSVSDKDTNVEHISNTKPAETKEIHRPIKSARVRLEGRIYVDNLEKHPDKVLPSKAKAVAKELGFDYFEPSMFYLTADGVAEIHSNMYKLLVAFRSINLMVWKYTVVEVMIDSHANDVWNLITEPNAVKERK